VITRGAGGMRPASTPRLNALGWPRTSESNWLDSKLNGKPTATGRLREPMKRPRAPANPAAPPPKTGRCRSLSTTTPPASGKEGPTMARSDDAHVNIAPHKTAATLLWNSGGLSLYLPTYLI